MPLPLTRPRGSGLVAAAASYTRKSETKYAERRSLTWQRRSLSYIDLVPELSYSSRFYSRMLRPLRIFPATTNSQNEIKAIESGPPVDMLNRLRGRDGTMTQILGNYGRLMFSTGEGVLLGLNLDTEDEYWSFVWNDEVEVELTGSDQDKKVKQIKHIPVAGQEGKVYGPDQARVYRLWVPHPRRSGEADSPMRSVLEIAEELIILTAAVRSTAVARTVQGLLLMPQELSPGSAEPEGDEDPEADPFIDEMLRHFETQVEDAGSAAAAAPWVVWGAYELLDRIRKIDLHDPQTDYMERDLRKEAVERLARGLDYPMEILTGLSNANHWAAKQILDDMWRSHGTGVADQFVADITDAYLRPSLREEKYEGWQDVVVAYDPSKVLVSSDQSADADAAYDRGQISGTGYRAMKNIPKDYAPTPEEHEEWLAIKMRDATLLGVEQQPSQIPRNVSEGPPPPGPEGDSGRRTRVTAAAVEMGAAEMALARCRELAGIRIRQKERSLPASVKLDGHPNSGLPAFVGADVLQQMALSPAQLVGGGSDTFRGLLCEWGYGRIQAAAICEMVESYAAHTLFRVGHPQLPTGFAAQFERAKEASSVSHSREESVGAA